MTFLTPLLAGIAAAIAIPTLLILYFLKLRRRDVEISSTFLWKKAIQDLQANAPFQKLRRNILLLLQLLALAAALFALAQPEYRGLTSVGVRHVIFIDRSASMNALDETNDAGEPVTRLEAARERAKKLVDSLREPGFLDKEKADSAMVITFSSEGEVRQTFTSDKDLLRAAIDAIEPTDAPTSAEQAFRLAQAHRPKRILMDRGADDTQAPTAIAVEGLVGGEPVVMHFWSDGRIPDAARIGAGDRAAIAPDDSIIYERLGDPAAPNIGITNLRSERAFDNPDKLSIFAALQSTDVKERKIDVDLLIDGETAASYSVTLPAATANLPSTPTPLPPDAKKDPAAPPTVLAAPPPTPGTGGVVFPIDRPQGGVITVRLAPGTLGPDSLPTDNTAFLVAPPAKRLAVATVTRGSLFIAAALEGLPLSKNETFTPEEWQKVISAGRAGLFDVVILDGYLPEGASPGALPPGRFLIFNAVPTFPEGLADKGEGPEAVMMTWSRDHPALRGLVLDSVVMAKSRLVEVAASGSAKTLATTSTGPAIVELAAATTRALVVPFDIGETNWPFDVSFVVFTAQAISYLGEEGGVLARALQPGATLNDRLPQGSERVRVAAPDGKESTVSPAPDGQIVFGPILRSGVYSMSWSGPPGPIDAVVSGRSVRPFAANLLDAPESDVTPAPELSLGARLVTADPNARSGATRRVWPWLMLAALGVIMFEWYIYNRKVQI